MGKESITSKVISAIGELVTMAFVIIFMAFMAPIVVTICFLGIFIPHKFIFSEESIKKDWLKRGTFIERFWFFVDTRGSLLSFDGDGSKPLRRSVNRAEWLKREIAKMNRYAQDKGNDLLCPGFTDFCKKQARKYETELLDKV